MKFLTKTKNNLEQVKTKKLKEVVVVGEGINNSRVKDALEYLVYRNATENLE